MKQPMRNTRKSRFISRSRYQNDRAWQAEIIPLITDKHFGTHGCLVERGKFEYFFYTDTNEKAAALLKELESYG